MTTEASKSAAKVRRPIKREANATIPVLFEVRSLGYFREASGYFDTREEADAACAKKHGCYVLPVAWALPEDAEQVRAECRAAIAAATGSAQ